MGHATHLGFVGPFMRSQDMDPPCSFGQRKDVNALTPTSFEPRSIWGSGLGVGRWFSKCGLLTSSTSITWAHQSLCGGASVASTAQSRQRSLLRSSVCQRGGRAEARGLWPGGRSL